MAPARDKAPFREFYARALKACADLWPLLGLRLAYLLLNYGAFFLLLLLTCWPLLQRIAGESRQGNLPGPERLEALALDFLQGFQDPGTLLPALGLLALYLVWWTLLAAWFNGGLYAGVAAYLQAGRPFGLALFWKEGLALLVPMVLLQGLLGSVFLVVFGVLVEGAFLGGFALGAAGVPGWVCLLLALPLLPLLLILALALVVYAFVAQACLVREGGVWHSFQEGYRRCVKDRFRILGILGLFLLLWSVAEVLVGIVFNLLELIPLLGVLFLAVDVVLSLCATAAFGVYFPALALAALSEKEARA